MDTYPQIMALLSAELVFLLARSSDIIVVLKLPKQRTKLEQSRVDRGLLRSIVLEGILFVPVSAILLILLVPLLLPKQMLDGTRPVKAVYALMGIVSYGFPYAAIRSTHHTSGSQHSSRTYVTRSR